MGSLASGSIDSQKKLPVPSARGQRILTTVRPNIGIHAYTQRIPLDRVPLDRMMVLMAGASSLPDFDDTDPLEDLDFRYLQDPTDAELRSGGVIGNRYYQGDTKLCSAGCGRRAKLVKGPNSLQKRKTCGDPECLHKVLSAASKRNSKNRPRRSCSRADYGGILPEGTPFREKGISQEEITRMIDEGDRKTWRM